MGCFLLFSSCLTEYYQVQLSGLHEYWTLTIYLVMYPKSIFGAIAQLARAPALQAGCPGFESPSLHHIRLIGIRHVSIKSDWGV